MGTLHGPRCERKVVRAEEAALVREPIVGEGPQHELQCFGHPFAAFGDRHAKARKVGRVAAAAHTELHATVAQNVQRRDLLGQTERVGERELRDRSAQSQRAGSSRDRRQENRRTRHDRYRRVEVVLHGPDGLEPQRFGVSRLLDGVAVALYRGLPVSA